MLVNSRMWRDPPPPTRAPEVSRYESARVLSDLTGFACRWGKERRLRQPRSGGDLSRAAGLGRSRSLSGDPRRHGGSGLASTGPTCSGEAPTAVVGQGTVDHPPDLS